MADDWGGLINTVAPVIVELPNLSGLGVTPQLPAWSASDTSQHDSPRPRTVWLSKIWGLCYQKPTVRSN